ncbi:DUF4145 domain-containing protein [Xanthomonas campestris pv. campestris]|uniref:DUF4145 domain-containing protein n=1 Tax=Xanthomonas campestris TaxID=339 RepID=UPI001F405F44|nr:DUF4145 domain-containing protein [Xanthomonas campestris]MCF8809658.1 DUF4145 domain-containing protein [Xanthomonas campestris pv. campestris]
MPTSTATEAAKVTAEATTLDWLGFVGGAIGSLAWPVAVVSIAWMFRDDLRALLPKLDSIKAAGLDLAFSERVRSLDPLPEEPAPPMADAASILQQPNDVTSATSPPETQAADNIGDEEPAAQAEGSEAPSGVGKPYKEPEPPFEWKFVREPGADYQSPSKGGLAELIKSLPPQLANRVISDLADYQTGPTEFDRFQIALNNITEALEIINISPIAAIHTAWRTVEHSLYESAKAHSQGSLIRTRPGTVNVMDLLKYGILSKSLANRYKELQNLRNVAVHSEVSQPSAKDAEIFVFLADDFINALRAHLRPEE